MGGTLVLRRKMHFLFLISFPHRNLKDIKDIKAGSGEHVCVCSWVCFLLAFVFIQSIQKVLPPVCCRSVRQLQTHTSTGAQSHPKTSTYFTLKAAAANTHRLLPNIQKHKLMPHGFSSRPAPPQHHRRRSGERQTSVLKRPGNICSTICSFVQVCV